MQITHRFIRGGKVLSLGLLLATSGCLVSGSASQKRTGHYVSETTLAKVEPGKTTEGWIIATLGEPDTRSKLDDGTQVLRWQYTESTQNHTAVFLIFGGSDKKETDGSVYVELKDGVVTNKWRA